MVRLFLLFQCMLLLFAAPAFSKENPTVIGIGVSIPPYVIAGDDKGIEVDIIRAAAERAGMDVEIRYLPNRRLPVSYQDAVIDAVAINRKFDLKGETGRQAHPSDTTLSFMNSAITLHDGPTIFEIKELRFYSVAAFVNASKYLGPTYAAAVGSNENYTEVSDQEAQVGLLYSGRFEVIVSDIRIFLYFKQKLASSALAYSYGLDRKLKFNDIFEKAQRCVYFFDPKERDTFNSGIESIYADGTIDEIISRYIKMDQ